MKVTIISGSPHKDGTTALLTAEFIRGAQEAGWEIVRFDAAFEQIAPCLGCEHCRAENIPCVQKDGMERLISMLLDSQAVALVTPTYYFGFSSQLKRVIDRFYAYNHLLTGAKRVFLLAAAHGQGDWISKPLITHYQTLARYLKWEDNGMVLAMGCGVRADIEHTKFLQEAYELGCSLRR